MNKFNSFHRFLWALTVIFSLMALAACSADTDAEPTPILPPPNTNIGGSGTGDTAVSPTLEPGQVVTGTNVAAGTAVTSTTPALQPTPTLIPTATIIGTPAATPATNPPVQAVTSGQLPATTRDLLFLADGAFKRWNHTTRQIETLLPGPAPADRVREQNDLWHPVVGDLTSYSVSADGKRAIVARLTASTAVTRTNTTGDGHQYPDVDTQHELWLIDTVSGQNWRIVSRVDNLGALALSPDARHVAFQGASLDGGYVVQESGEPIKHVYFVPTGGGSPGPITDVAACTGYCGPLAWHPDNNLFVWNDNTAVWLKNLAGRESEQLIQNRPFNEQSPDIANVAVYSPIAWAGNGRYLLLWKGGWEGGSRAIFDVPTDALVDMPETSAYAETFPTEVSWMRDDRLLVLRSEGAAGGLGQPQMELWRFQPDQGTVVQEESARLSTQNLGAAGALHLQDGRFAYVLFSDQPDPEAGAYHLTALTEMPERVNASPPVPFLPTAASATWSNDGSGVLIVPNDMQRVYYSAADGEFLYDVTAVLGAEPHKFHWQP